MTTKNNKSILSYVIAGIFAGLFNGLIIGLYQEEVAMWLGIGTGLGFVFGLLIAWWKLKSKE
ncbi:MAG: hypothetical protein ACXIUD_15470 [Mongoliitalea sp.]